MSSQPQKPGNGKTPFKLAAIFLATLIGAQVLPPFDAPDAEAARKSRVQKSKPKSKPKAAPAVPGHETADRPLAYSCIQDLTPENVRLRTAFSDDIAVRTATAYALYMRTKDNRNPAAAHAVLESADDEEIKFMTHFVEAMIESDLGRVATATWVKTSMRGLYQYHPQTWLHFFKYHGARYKEGMYKDLVDAIRIDNDGYARTNDEATKKKILDLRNDHDVAAFIKAAQLKYDDGPKLRTILSREPEMTDYYIFYFFGEGDGRKFFKGLLETPNSKANAATPKAARYNKPLFYTNGKALSFQEFYDKVKGRLDARMTLANTRVDQILQEHGCIPARRNGRGDPFPYSGGAAP